MSSSRVKRLKRDIIDLHAKADDLKALTQVTTTLVPLALLWVAAAFSARISLGLTVPLVGLISLFTLRMFALMHDCGHGSLFRTSWLNRAFGFFFGVMAGMPQYVWSQHHNFHHATNGNWEKYRGPLTTLSIDEYAAMTESEQRRYRQIRSIAVAPAGGFIYLIFNPRVTWIKGSVQLLIHLLKGKLARPRIPLGEHAASFQTRYWQSRKEYWHMFWNNVALLSLLALLCWAFGTALACSIYLISVSLAGGAGLVLFTVQHNFEHAYASETKEWDFDTGTMEGTSFLILPFWLNWFTVDIAYHHVHHLSANIPNYQLVGCHNQYQELFADVPRVRLSQIPRAAKCILWDTRARRIISISEYERQLQAVPQT